MCYAHCMGATLISGQTWRTTPLDRAGVERLRRERGWRLWVAPRPFTLVSSVVYLGALYYTFWGGDCSNSNADCGPSWWSVVSAACLLTLLALDRLDYWLYGETPPARVGFMLLALRLALTTIVVVVLDLWMGTFLLPLVPYVASFYFGVRGASLTAALVWLIQTPIIAVSVIPHMTRVGVYRDGQETIHYLVTSAFIGAFVNGLCMMTILLVFVASAARVACMERAGRARVEALLARLDDSHRTLRVYSQKALQATEERNRVAREIHSRVGHYLAEVGVQIQNALALRSRDPEGAEQAVRNAKGSVSQALGDARRSVATLRSSGSDEGSLMPDNASIAEHQVETDNHSRPPTRNPLLAWLAPRPFDVAATTLYWGVVVMDLAWPDPADPNGPWRSLGMLGVALLLTLLDRLDFRLFDERPPVPAGALLLAARVALFLLLFLGLGVWYALLLIALIPYICLVYFGDRAGYVAGALVWLGIGMMGLLAMLEELRGYSPLGPALAGYVGGLLAAMFMVGVVVATARVVVLERAARARALQLLDNLREAYTNLAEGSRKALAAVRERNSLARDVHDGLGHYLTVAGVQLEKALAYRTISPEVADQALLDSQRMAREALQEVRATVGTLRDAQTQSLANSLQELVSRLDRSGPTITLQIEGDEEGYSTQALTALFRAAQEGLTNVQKHANAKRVWLHLQLGESEARLELADDGQGFEASVLEPRNSHTPGQEKGYGLQSMEERLELVGGSLQIWSLLGHGTRLEMRVGKSDV